MAFILQESSYIQGAKPERTKLLGFIPWKRKSSAFGYAQALDGTWERYKKEAKKTFAYRRNFDDSIDFIAWYNNLSHKKIESQEIMQDFCILLIMRGKGVIKRVAIEINLGLLMLQRQFKTMLIDINRNLIVVRIS